MKKENKYFKKIYNSQKMRMIKKTIMDLNSELISYLTTQRMKSDN